MRLLRRLLLALLFVGLLVGGWRLAAENSGTLAIHYLAGSLEGIRVWAALLVAFSLGAAAAILLATVRGTRLRLEGRRYRKAVRGLEAEVHQLRNLPLASGEADADEEPAETAGRGP